MTRLERRPLKRPTREYLSIPLSVTAADSEGDKFDAEKAATDASSRFPKPWGAWQLLSKSIDWRIAEGTKDRPMSRWADAGRDAAQRTLVSQSPEQVYTLRPLRIGPDCAATLRSLRMYDPTN